MSYGFTILYSIIVLFARIKDDSGWFIHKNNGNSQTYFLQAKKRPIHYAEREPAIIRFFTRVWSGTIQILEVEGGPAALHIISPAE